MTKKVDLPIKFSISRPAASTAEHLKMAYGLLRSGSERKNFIPVNCKKTKNAIARASEFVESAKADPYEFMRALFLTCPGAYPYLASIGSEWAINSYHETYRDGPSMGLRKFILEKERLSMMVLSHGTPLDEAIRLSDFSALSKVIHCSEVDFPEVQASLGKVAAEKMKWDRDLKCHILKNYEFRSARAFQSTLAVEPPESPVEVGPSKAPSCQRGNIPN